MYIHTYKCTHLAVAHYRQSWFQDFSHIPKLEDSQVLHRRFMMLAWKLITYNTLDYVISTGDNVGNDDKKFTDGQYSCDLFKCFCHCFLKQSFSV